LKVLEDETIPKPEFWWNTEITWQIRQNIGESGSSVILLPTVFELFAAPSIHPTLTLKDRVEGFGVPSLLWFNKRPGLHCCIKPRAEQSFYLFILPQRVPVVVSSTETLNAGGELVRSSLLIRKARFKEAGMVAGRR
jgi:hypothetical protein